MKVGLHIILSGHHQNEIASGNPLKQIYSMVISCNGLKYIVSQWRRGPIVSVPLRSYIIQNPKMRIHEYMNLFPEFNIQRSFWFSALTMLPNCNLWFGLSDYITDKPNIELRFWNRYLLIIIQSKLTSCWLLKVIIFYPTSY